MLSGHGSWREARLARHIELYLAATDDAGLWVGGWVIGLWLCCCCCWWCKGAVSDWCVCISHTYDLQSVCHTGVQGSACACYTIHTHMAKSCGHTLSARKTRLHGFACRQALLSAMAMQHNSNSSSSMAGLLVRVGCCRGCLRGCCWCSRCLQQHRQGLGVESRIGCVCLHRQEERAVFAVVAVAIDTAVACRGVYVCFMSHWLYRQMAACRLLVDAG